MPPAGFEPANPASERPQIHALDRAVTGIGRRLALGLDIISCNHEVRLTLIKILVIFGSPLCPEIYLERLKKTTIKAVMIEVDSFEKESLISNAQKAVRIQTFPARHQSYLQ
jgi:hypothetical protein